MEVRFTKYQNFYFKKKKKKATCNLKINFSPTAIQEVGSDVYNFDSSDLLEWIVYEYSTDILGGSLINTSFLGTECRKRLSGTYPKTGVCVREYSLP